MRAFRARLDYWARCRTIRKYQLRRDALSDNLPTFRTKW